MTYSRESDLAADVARHYQNNQFRVWAEVEIPGLQERPDLVGIDRHGALFVIETKLTLSWEAVAQASQWVDYANRSVLVVPYATRIVATNREAQLIRDVCRMERIGLATMGGAYSGIVPSWINHQPKDCGLLDALKSLPEYDPETALKHPGTPGRAERPELAEIRRMLVAAVYAMPGRRINRYREILTIHNNTNQVVRVIRDAKAGKVPGVMAVRSGGLWRLQPASEEKAA